MNKLVSIIFPVYNVENYIEKSFKSLINQTYKNLEIIVVNDGSTDRSIELIKPYFDERVKLINKENGGLSSARNAGLNVATGDYVFFLDSDDWIEKNAISVLMNSFTDEIDIVQGSINQIYNNVKKTVIFHDELIKSNIVQEYFKKEKLSVTVWNKLYKMNFIKNMKFVEGCVNEDVFFTFDIAKKQPVLKNINNVVINYIQRKNSIMHKTDFDKRIQVEKALNYVIEETKNINSEYQCLAYFDKYITLLYLYAQMKIGQINYSQENMNYIVLSLKRTKSCIKYRTIKDYVNKRQKLMFLLSLFSKKVFSKFYEINDRKRWK